LKKGMDLKKPHERVLCVGPLLPALRSLQEAIQRQGYDVLLAFTADHAVAVSIANSCDAVIVDAELIRAEGATLAETLKLARPEIPVLLLDHREDQSRRDALPKGVDAAVVGKSHGAVLAWLAAIFEQKHEWG
jgi:DNA-binding response OmpR family regulator